MYGAAGDLFDQIKSQESVPKKLLSLALPIVPPLWPDVLLLPTRRSEKFRGPLPPLSADIIKKSYVPRLVTSTTKPIWLVRGKNVVHFLLSTHFRLFGVGMPDAIS